MNTTYKMAIALVLCIISVVYLLNSAVNDISKNLSAEENTNKEFVKGKKTMYIVSETCGFFNVTGC